MASSCSLALESYISNLDCKTDIEVIKVTLKNIREKIHTSKQFYKEFLIKFHSCDGVRSLLELIRTKLNDEEVIDLTLSVLATCCMDRNNATEVKESSGISIIATALRHYSNSSASIINRCARALANLARSVDIEDRLRTDEDVIPLLVQALRETEDCGCCHSLLRVLKMFSFSKDKTILWSILECGGLRSVCSKLKCPDVKLLLMAVETVVALTAPFDKRKSSCRPSLPTATANPAIESDSLANLFDLLSHRKSEVQCRAWESIGNLMSNNIGRAALGNAGFVKFYLATARNDAIKVSVRERCAQYLCLCCQESVNRAKMLELDGIRFLVELLDGRFDSLTVVPSAVVIAAIAEFRYDVSALEQFACLNLVKILVTCLEKKMENQNGKGIKSDVTNDGSITTEGRKRKKKKHRTRSKRVKKEEEEEDAEINRSDPEINRSDPETNLLVSSASPWLYPHEKDDGLSPQYQSYWCPESPQLSPGSHSSVSGTSPARYYLCGISPPRAHCSGEVSPPNTCNPTYQFPSSMMSPPKSDITSPGSSPTYFYGPSSPQKVFTYGEEVFSPVVSEASGSDSNTDNTDDVNQLESDSFEETDGRRGKMEGTLSKRKSDALLEQATKKLSLYKENEGNVSSQSYCSGDTQTQHTTSVCSDEALGDDNKSGRCGWQPTCLRQITTKEHPISSAASLSHRAARVSPSPRISFGSDADLTDGEKTPMKCARKVRRVREEEENIVLILQEMILLHQVPGIMYIATEHSIQTLLCCATHGSVAKQRSDVLLKDILSSRFFFDRLVSHNIPCLIYRSMTVREKRFVKAMDLGGQEERKRRALVSFGEKEEVETNRRMEYLQLLRDTAATSFGQKEVEHILLGHQEESKFAALISLPYMYSSKSVLRHLLVDCATLPQLLERYAANPTREWESKVQHSLCGMSRLLLPKSESYIDTYFTVKESCSFGEDTMAQLDKEGSNSCDPIANECLYQAQEKNADVSLVCDGNETIRANRQVLAARSEYFACLLSGNFREAEQETIRLEGMRATSVECILHGLYDCHPARCRSLRILYHHTLDSLLDILATAKYYMTIKSSREEQPEICLLEQKVTSIILNFHLSESSACKLAKFAALHNCQKFLLSCLLFILRVRSNLRNHLRELLTSQFGDVIRDSIIGLFKE